jgi:uncharacterized membrane protein
VDVLRILKHLFAPDWIARRPFTPAVLKTIEQAITASEQSHDGELRFVFEASLPLHYLSSKGGKARARAADLFSLLKVWDTEHNSGVLIYVQLVDRRIEIVADRGIAAKVEQAEWDAVCREMEKAFRAGRFAEGALHAVGRTTTLLARHFPARAANPNELPDKPVVL